MDHCQFGGFLSNMESEYRSTFCCMEVRLLSRGRVFKRVQNSNSETELFLEMKGRHSPHLCDHDWMCHFAFCIDITRHIN
jgi:hypothetical protein